MATLQTYIDAAYNEDVAVYLKRMITLLNTVYDGWDDSDVVSILHNGDNSVGVDMKIRASIVNIMRSTLNVYGIMLTDDDIPLEVYCGILGAIVNAEDIDIRMQYTDAVETMAHFTEGFCGLSAVDVATYIDKVHHTTIAAILKKETKPVAPSLLLNIMKLTEQHGTNMASSFLTYGIVPGLSVEYYLELFGTQIRSDIKGMVLDVYSIMMLAEVDVHVHTRDWINNRNLLRVDRNKAIKYLSSLR